MKDHTEHQWPAEEKTITSFDHSFHAQNSQHQQPRVGHLQPSPPSVPVPMQMLVNPNGPTTPNGVEHRKKKLSRTDVIHALCFFLDDYHHLIANPARQFFLQCKNSGSIHPIKSDIITSQLRLFALERLNQDISDTLISRALDLFLARTRAYEASELTCGRVYRSPDGRSLYYNKTPECLNLWHDPNCTYAGLPAREGIPLTVNHAAIPDIAQLNHNEPLSTLRGLFEAHSLPESEYIVLLTWMVSTVVHADNTYLLELIDQSDVRVDRLQTIIKRIIDYCKIDHIPEMPTQRKSFENWALQHYLLSFRNVEGLTSISQQHLLRLLNGCTIEVDIKPSRYRYDVQARCPVMFNADESVVTCPKLAERTITLYLSEQQYGSPDLTKERIHYLSAFLRLVTLVNHDFLSTGFFHKSEPRTPQSIFLALGRIVCTHMGVDKQLFLRTWNLMNQTRNELSLSETPVAQAVIQFLSQQDSDSHEHSTQGWLDCLTPLRPESAQSLGWPGTARAMGAALKKAIPVLKARRIACQGKSRNGYRVWSIERTRS